MAELEYKRIPAIGDGVNQSTQMWAEEWINRIENSTNG